MAMFSFAGSSCNFYIAWIFVFADDVRIEYDVITQMDRSFIFVSAVT